MPVSTQLLLPANVRAHHVRAAIARLIGFDIPAEQFHLVHDKYVRFVQTTGTVQSFTIEYGPTRISRTPWCEEEGCLNFHYEGDSASYKDRLSVEGRLITVPLSTRNLALLHRLAKLFGGRVTADNHEGTILYSYRSKPARHNAPVYDEDWNALAQCINQLKPITNRNLNPYKKWMS